MSWSALQAELAKKKAALVGGNGAGGGGKYVRRGDISAGANAAAQPPPSSSSSVPSSSALSSSSSSSSGGSFGSGIDSSLRPAGKSDRAPGEDRPSSSLDADKDKKADEKADDTGDAGAGGGPPPAKRRRIEEASDGKEQEEPDAKSTGQQNRSRSGSKERPPASSSAGAGGDLFRKDDKAEKEKRKEKEKEKEKEKRTMAFDALKYKPSALVIAGFPNTVKVPASSSSSSSSSSQQQQEEDSTTTKEIPVGTEPDEHKFCYKWIRGTLNEWEDELLRTRPFPDADIETASEDGRMWTQSCEYIAPLLKRLKDRSLDEDVRKLVVEIAGDCLAREYAAAGDAYVRLAIGNARWPIGVTAVGLHERAAREKVYEGKQAHVMHNEESRKYVTILKRLITFSQRRYPTVPSKMVMS